MEQRTAKWYRARLGNFGASEVAELRGKARKADEIFTQTAKSLIYKKLGERMLNEALVDDDEWLLGFIDRTNPINRAMQLGIDTECEARKAYATYMGVDVVESSIFFHPRIPHLHASPDGLIGDDGLLEIKCPGIEKFATYCAEVKTGEDLGDVNPTYFWQVQCQLACTGRKWCDWMAYNPDCKRPIHIVRIFPNKEVIEDIETKVVLANVEINKMMKGLFQ